MATPYIKNDGVNYKIQAGLPSAGVATLQFTDSASSPVITVPNLTGTMALTTIATGTNTLVTTDMATGFRALDGLVMPNVLGYLTNTPPVSPANGDTYIIGAAPTGAWAGQGGKVTRYSTVVAAWEFFTPKNGWMIGANTAREIYRYTAGAWEIFYQEGTWPPILNSFAVTGSPVLTGKYFRVGKNLSIYCSLDANAGSIGSTGGTSSISGLPFSPNMGGGMSVGSNYADNFTSASLISGSNIYPPTWAAANKVFYISGSFPIA